MKFDLGLNFGVFILALSIVVITLFSGLHQNVSLDLTLTSMSILQIILLITLPIFSFFYLQFKQLKFSIKMFWLWMMLGWFLMLGGLIDWCFMLDTEVSTVYTSLYLGIYAIFLLSLYVYKPVRKAILFKLKHQAIPLWYLILALIALIFSEMIHYSGSSSGIFFQNVVNQDLVHAFYELSFMLAVFLTAFQYMKKDKYDPYIDDKSDVLDDIEHKNAQDYHDDSCRPCESSNF